MATSKGLTKSRVLIQHNLAFRLNDGALEMAPLLADGTAPHETSQDWIAAPRAGQLQLSPENLAVIRQHLQAPVRTVRVGLVAWLVLIALVIGALVIAVRSRIVGAA